MSDENYSCMYVSFDSLHIQEAAHELGFRPHHAVLQPIVQVHMVNFKHLDEEKMMRVWEQKQLS